MQLSTGEKAMLGLIGVALGISIYLLADIRAERKETDATRRRLLAECVATGAPEAQCRYWITNAYLGEW